MRQLNNQGCTTELCDTIATSKPPHGGFFVYKRLPPYIRKPQGSNIVDFIISVLKFSIIVSGVVGSKLGKHSVG